MSSSSRSGKVRLYRTMPIAPQQGQATRMSVRPFVSSADRLTAKGGLLPARSGHAEVEVQRDPDRRHPEGRRERGPVADLTRKHGVSKATFCKWPIARSSVAIPHP